MIVYVETNFLLEVAFQQEEHLPCSALLAELAGGTLDIRIPAFAIAEARLARRRRAAERTELLHRVQRELRELSRAAEWSELRAQSGALLGALTASGEAARGRLEAAIEAIVRGGRVLPLDAEIIARAGNVENWFALASPDALVFASVMQDAERVDAGAKIPPDKCFLNRNAPDFTTPPVQDELRRVSCRLLTSFRGGLAFVRPSEG